MICRQKYVFWLKTTKKKRLQPFEKGSRRCVMSSYRTKLLIFAFLFHIYFFALCINEFIFKEG